MKMARKSLLAASIAVVVVLASVRALPAQTAENATAEKLKDFDAWMAQVLKDWNVPGIGVGIVVDDKLVFAKGYGYRDYGQNGQVKALKQRDPSGEFTFPKK